MRPLPTLAAAPVTSNGGPPLTMRPKAALPPPIPVQSLLSDGREVPIIPKRVKGAEAQEWHAIIRAKGFDVVGGRMRQIEAPPTMSSMSRQGTLVVSAGLATPARTNSSPMKTSWDLDRSPRTSTPGWGRRGPSGKVSALSPAARGLGRASSSSKRISALPLDRPPRDHATSTRGQAEKADGISFLGRMNRSSAFSTSLSKPISAPNHVADSITGPPVKPTSIFTGLRFALHGDANCDVMRDEISRSGGLCLHDGVDEAQVDFHIVRLAG